MPRTRSLAWSELKIGIIAVAAMILAAMIIVAVGGAAGFSWQRYQLKTKFPDVKGIKSGAVVRVAGVEVGKVTDVQFAGAEVEVILEVKKGNEQRITSNSRASIGSLSLLGEPIIDVSPATTGTPLKDGDYIQAGRAPGQLADVADGARATLEQLTATLEDIRKGKGTVGKLFTDDELYKEVTQFMNAAQGVTSNLRDGRGTLGRLLKDPVAYERLNASLADLQAMTQRINAGEGSLGRFLKDDALAKSLTNTSANLESITGQLKRGDNTMGKLLTEKELYDRFNAIAAKMDSVVSDIQKSDGSLQLLVRDKQLYENINGAAKEARALIEAIKADPKKYSEYPSEHFLDRRLQETQHMSRDDGGAAGTVVVAFLLGAVTGAAVALLLAPASGEETRKVLTEKAKEGREKATDAARQGREFLNRQRDTLSTAIDRGRDAYNQARTSPMGPTGESL